MYFFFCILLLRNRNYRIKCLAWSTKFALSSSHVFPANFVHHLLLIQSIPSVRVPRSPVISCQIVSFRSIVKLSSNFQIYFLLCDILPISLIYYLGCLSVLFAMPSGHLYDLNLAKYWPVGYYSSPGFLHLVPSLMWCVGLTFLERSFLAES